MSDKKEIQTETIDQLEESKKDVLKRIAENLKNQKVDGNANASHSSHSSNPLTGRTHSSYINS
jgi:hypothetical protein